MNKRELVRALKEQGYLTVAQAARAVDAIFDAKRGIIPEEIRAGRRVQIPGFGTFEAKQRPARTGRNPRTGTEISIPESTSPAFRPARGLKDAVLTGSRDETVTRGEAVARGETVTRGPAGTGSTSPRKSRKERP